MVSSVLPLKLGGASGFRFVGSRAELTVEELRHRCSQVVVALVSCTIFLFLFGILDLSELPVAVLFPGFSLFSLNMIFRF